MPGVILHLGSSGIHSGVLLVFDNTRKILQEHQKPEETAAIAILHITVTAVKTTRRDEGQLQIGPVARDRQHYRLISILFQTQPMLLS